MIEELYPRFVVYQRRLRIACLVIQYLLLASLFLAIALFFISKHNVTLFVYVNYHYSFRHILPETFSYIPIIFTFLYWVSTSKSFILINYNAGKSFRKESRKDFALRQASYSCGTWFSWLTVCTIFILIALSAICSSPNWYGWLLYLYYTIFVLVLNHYFYSSFCAFFKKLEEFADIS